MPQADVVLYREDDGSVPVREWFLTLPPKAADKCLARLKRLEQLGHELRRPEADFLRDGIYELRASYQGRHYRMLYFFVGRQAVVVSHGLVKEREVPAKEIDKATERKRRFEESTKAHTFRPER
jgi:phage-related protein